MKAFYIGSYAPAGENSIFQAVLDERTEKMQIAPVCSCAENPSYLLAHPNGQILYAVEERVPDGGIAVFRRDEGALTKLAALPSGGSAPCHLALDDRADFLFVSNYMSGSLAVFALNPEGLITGMCDLKQHIGSGMNPLRQEGPHVHSSRYLNGYLYVCDLGLDTLFCYRLDPSTGKLEETGKNLRLDAGSGPRHSCYLQCVPNLLYVDAELSGQVFVVDLEENRILQRIRAVPDALQTGFTVGAICAQGDLLYVSNRGFDSFAAFRILPDGLLQLLKITPHAGRTPRDFICTGDYLLSADQDSQRLSLLKRDADGGLVSVGAWDFSPAMPSIIQPLEIL
ncbi:MAG: lactonase family protein [Clostridia bacterium]|nr:lactonase family protein [Clostridia bacterium]